MRVLYSELHVILLGGNVTFNFWCSSNDRSLKTLNIVILKDLINTISSNWSLAICHLCLNSISQISNYAMCIILAFFINSGKTF